MKTILLVDDEPIMLKMLKWRLETQGYQVINAASGIEALKIIETQTIDIVITDVRMPIMDGLTLVKKMKQLDQAPPCLVMSGHGDIDMNSLAQQVGANGYVSKPVKFEELNQLVEHNMNSLQKQN